MKRDWDCIRGILLGADWDPGFPNGGETSEERYGEKFVRHLELAAQAGFLGRPRASHEDWVVSVEGRRIVDLMGSDEKWARIKELAVYYDIPLIVETIEILSKRVEREELAEKATRMCAEAAAGR